MPLPNCPVSSGTASAVFGIGAASTTSTFFLSYSASTCALAAFDLIFSISYSRAIVMSNGDLSSTALVG